MSLSTLKSQKTTSGNLSSTIEPPLDSSKNPKDVQYYAQKILGLKDRPEPVDPEKRIKDIIYYTGKIASLYETMNTDAKDETTTGDMGKKSRRPLKKKTIVNYINKISEIQEKEEIESEAVKRYAFFPILDEKGYEFYQKQEITHWSESELDFIADRKHYNEASTNVKTLIDTILAFFLVGDGVISRNIIFRFLLECKTYEEQAMFISQLHIELIHAATYGLAALTFKRDPNAMADLIESAQNTPCVKRKMLFMEKWMMSDRPKYQRLVAFACAEGIFFSTLFAVIFWFRSKGLFPNFILANELIGNDESLHRDWGAFLFCQEISVILEKYEKGSDEYNRVYDDIKSSVYEIVLDAVNVEDEFANYILSEDLEDLNSKDLKTYARLIADNLLTQLSYSSHFRVKNPFTWSDDISMEQKGNFYEVRIGAYKKKSLTDVLNWRKRAGLIEETINVYDNPEDVDF
jgi:ribonucleotide reductase beta subunit family protein with ferritin-like domain